MPSVQPLASAVRRAAAMSLDEAVTRSRQAVSRMGSRWFWSHSDGESIPIPVSRPVIAPALLDFWRTAESAQTLDPMAAIELVRRADEICQGRFHILGYEALDFGQPVNWHLDPVHRRETPRTHFSRIQPLDASLAGDHKIVWELNRHSFMVTLAQVYALTNDHTYARRAARLLDEWLAANPPGVGITWVSSLEVGLRAIAWLYVWPVFRSSPHFDQALCQRWLRSIDSHARHVASYLSYYFAPNTHLLGEGLALYLVGLGIPELSRAAYYKRLGQRILKDQFGKQLRADGFHFEQSSCYHRYTIEFLLVSLLATAMNGFQPFQDTRRTLDKVVDAILPLVRPDGTLVNIGDEDGGQLWILGTRDPLDARPVLAACAVALRRGDLKFIAGKLPSEVIWLMGSKAYSEYADLPEKRPQLISQRIEAAGYCSMRDGWSSDSSHLLFDAGPHGAAACRYGHAHADALSVNIVARGIPFVIDPGTGSYSDAEIRERLRSTFAHSTAWIDGKPQCEAGRTFEWRTTADGELLKWLASEEIDFAEATHDGYARGPSPAVHRRRIVYWKDHGWLLWDLFEGTGDHTVTLQFILAADPDEVTVTEMGLATAVGTIGTLPPRRSVNVSQRLAPIMASRRYGKFATATAFQVNATARFPADFVTVIRCGADAPVAHLVDAEEADRGATVDGSSRSLRDTSAGDHIVLRTIGRQRSRQSDSLEDSAAVVWESEGRTLIVGEQAVDAWIIADGRPEAIAADDSWGWR